MGFNYFPHSEKTTIWYNCKCDCEDGNGDTLEFATEEQALAGTSQTTMMSPATTKAVVDQSLTNKQDKLTAGTNITIEDGVISASGSGGSGTYTLPTATPDTLGGIKIGNSLTISSDGTLSGNPNIYGFVNKDDVLVILFSTAPAVGEYKLDLTDTSIDTTASYDLNDKEFYYKITNTNALYAVRIWRKDKSVYENVVCSWKHYLVASGSYVDSVKTISIGTGENKKIYTPDKNGDINFADTFYTPVRGIEIANGKFSLISGGGKFSSTWGYVDVDKLTFTINPDDLQAAKGIAMEFDLAWSSNYNSTYSNSWLASNTNPTILQVSKLSEVSSSDKKDVYFRNMSDTPMNTLLFPTTQLTQTDGTTMQSKSIFGQFLRNYSGSADIDAFMKSNFSNGESNGSTGTTSSLISTNLDYKETILTGVKTGTIVSNVDKYQPSYVRVNGSQDTTLKVSSGNTITTLMGLFGNTLTVIPLPLTYYQSAANISSSTIALNIFMVPSKIYYYY